MLCRSHTHTHTHALTVTLIVSSPPLAPCFPTRGPAFARDTFPSGPLLRRDRQVQRGRPAARRRLARRAPPTPKIVRHGLEIRSRRILIHMTAARPFLHGLPALPGTAAASRRSAGRAATAATSGVRLPSLPSPHPRRPTGIAALCAPPAFCIHAPRSRVGRVGSGRLGRVGENGLCSDGMAIKDLSPHHITTTPSRGFNSSVP